jgi:hypothetical protein
MPKKKQFIVSPQFIDYIKTKIPSTEEEEWWRTEVAETLWEIPTKIHLKAHKNRDEEWEESKIGKKVKKLKLKYTQQEVKKAIQEDKTSLKDVKKLEEHLEEDIDKAENKLQK